MKRINCTLIFVFIATLAFSQNAKNVKASRNVNLFSATVTAEDHYSPGTTMDINFVLDFQTSDFEYGDYISLTFPNGITPNGSPTDPIAITHEGQVPCNLNGVSGQVTSWGTNNNDGWGGIEIGLHPFIVNVTIDAGVTGDQVVDILVSGAEYGTPQGDVNINCTLQELPSGPDLSVIATELEYTNYPLAQAFSIPISAEVSNSGLDLNTETELVVTCDLASYVETEAIPLPLSTGGSETFILPDVTSFTEGTHEIIFNASALDDPYLSNNSDTITIAVDSVYAHDDGSRVYAYGHTVFNYSIGTVFDIRADDDLTAAQFFLAESATIGDEFSLSVCPVSLFSPGETFTCGDPVWQSEGYVVDESMLEAWTTVTAENAVLLEVGEYALFIHEETPGSSIELGHDGNNTGDILMSVNETNYYWEDETFGYAMLRLVLGTKITTDIVETVNKEEISIFPNLTTGIVNIKNAKNQNVVIYNMQGIKVFEVNDASNIETIDISKYTSGSYIIIVGSKIERINLVK